MGGWLIGVLSTCLTLCVCSGAQEKPTEITLTVKHNGKTVPNPDHILVSFGDQAQTLAVRNGKLRVPAEISHAKTWSLMARIKRDQIEVRNLSRSALEYDDWTLHIADRHYEGDYSSHVPKGTDVRSTCIVVLNSEHIDPGLVIFQTHCRSRSDKSKGISYWFLARGNAASTQVLEGKDTPSPVRAVKVTVRTDHGKYSLKDDIRVNVLLENAGDETVFVDRRMFCCGIGTGLGLEVHDEQGRSVPLPHLQEELMPPPPSEDAWILVRLEAGFFYGRSYYLAAKDFFPKPGKYSIQFFYRNRLPREMVAPQLRDLPVLWDDSPTIPPEPVWIEVT